MWVSFRDQPLVAEIWDLGVQTLLYGIGAALVLAYMGLPYDANREVVSWLLPLTCGLSMALTFIMDDPVDAAKEILILGLMPVIQLSWLGKDPTAPIALIYVVGFGLLLAENLRQGGFWRWLFKVIKQMLASKPKLPRLVIRKHQPATEQTFEETQETFEGGDAGMANE